MMSIIDLEKRISQLSDEEKEVFKRIFSVSTSEGVLNIPQSFRESAWKYFGRRDERSGEIVESVEEVTARLSRQRIVRVDNRWTGESTLFNELRAFRPGMRADAVERMRKRVNEYIERSMNEGCDFCDAERRTPEDVFGRVRGKHCITASNIAKYDAFHSLVIFRKHNPLDFSKDELADYIKTGFKWFELANKYENSLEHRFFMWNCLERAGASQIHGHAQVLVSRKPYGKTLSLLRAANAYRRKYHSDYFNDLFKAHASLGLAFSTDDTTDNTSTTNTATTSSTDSASASTESRTKSGTENEGAYILAYLSPVKEKEVMIITRKPPTEREISDVVFKVLRCFIDKLGVFSFNLAILMPPISHEELGDKNNEAETRKEEWAMFPYIIRIVDRGDVFKRASDFGGMEIYGSSVVATDPFRVMDALKSYF